MKNIQSKIILLIVLSLIFLLSSCFESEDSIEDNDWNSVQTKYEHEDFSINIPAKWDLLNSVSEVLPKPSNWEIIFDAVSSIKSDNFYRNMLVLKQDIEEKSLSTLNYIIGNYIWSEKEYFYIKKISEKNVKISGENTKIYEFEARYSEDTPILNFIQTWVICSDNWYIITIAIEKNNKNFSRYESLLWSFKCKNINSELIESE